MGKASVDGNQKVEALVALDAARVAREQAELRERAAVAEARVAGVSWAKVGELYGLTKQGAQQRFKPGVKKVLSESSDQ